MNRIRTFDIRPDVGWAYLTSGLGIALDGAVWCSFTELLPDGYRSVLRRYSATGVREQQVLGPVISTGGHVMKRRVVAVDHSGNVYVAKNNPGTFGDAHLEVFGPDASVLLAVSTESLSIPSEAWLRPGVFDNECRLFVPHSFGLEVFLEDRDLDGLCDCWETQGIQVGSGQPPYRPSVLDPDHKNVLVEIDAMEGRAPSAAVLARVAAAFSNFPNDSLPVPNPDGLPGIILTCELSQTSLPRVAWGLDFALQFQAFVAAHEGEGEPAAIRAARRLLYRYCVFADTIPGGLSGRTAIGSRSILVSPGRAFRARFQLEGPKNDYLAGTFMHELGHSLGLDHGGSDGENFKPNYRSVMNYLWQTPLDRIRRMWKLEYSTRATQNVIDERHLNEPAGIGGTLGDSVFIGPPDFCALMHAFPGSRSRFQLVPEFGEVDWDCNPVTHLLDYSNRDVNDFLPGPHAARYSILRPSNDLRTLKLSAVQFGAARGGLPEEVNSPLSAYAIASLSDDNGNDVSDAEEIEADFGLDVDCDWILDAYEPSRIQVEADTITLCPMGDGGRLVLNLDLSGVCGVDLSDPSLRIFAVRESPLASGAGVWQGTGSWSPAAGDTLWGVYDSGLQRGSVIATRGRGCGWVTYRLVVGNSSFGGSQSVFVRGVDQDSHALGAVDWYDIQLANEQWGNGEACGDLNRDGETGTADFSLLLGHVGHSVERKVIFPNGGEVFEYGSFVDVNWLPGLGDSSVVSASIIRDSDPDFAYALVELGEDTGHITTPLYLPMAGSDFRVRVSHRAGRRSDGVGRAIGMDVSDGVFSVNAAQGGCPTLDVLSGSVWRVENTILGRSLSSALALDGYRLRHRADVVRGRVRLRVRENEQERTTLDQVRLIAVDHDPGVRAWSMGDQILLGTRVPAARVTTAAGVDVTSLFTGAGEGFRGALNRPGFFGELFT